jgi:prolyl-tRNA synthetase
MGLQAIPMRADAGPIGGDYTHEFLILAETGESEVFYDSEITDLRFGDREIDYDDRAQCQAVLEEFTSRYARTDETHDEAVTFRADPRGAPPLARGIEVGQIFYFGTEYSEPMGAVVSTTRASACRSTWAATGSASPACWARSSRPATTTAASSGPRG